MVEIQLEDQSLRDGLQLEHAILSLSQKHQLFNQLKNAGVPRIQVGSFVHPTIVPQMANTDNLVQQILPCKEVVVTGLALNDKGLARALATGIQHISLSASLSDHHSRKNVGQTSKIAIAAVTHLIQEAVQEGLSVRAGIQCAFGCTVEGTIKEQHVLDLIKAFTGAGATEINLADTTGMAGPTQIRTLLEKTNAAFPDTTFSLHLHDTRGLGLANMLAGYECGVRIFDTSAGGLGGCPFIKGSAGNVATEDAVNLFTSMGVDTGISLKKICKVTDSYEQLLGKKLPGHMSRVIHAQIEKNNQSGNQASATEAL